MAHFAQINENNIVTNVLVIPNEEEHRGQDYLANDMGFGGTWLQCSYNTMNNEHHLGGTPFRGNYPGPGFKYDSALDAFIPPKPEEYPSWILGEKIQWKPPVNPPDDSGNWQWNEDSVSWVASN